MQVAIFPALVEYFQRFLTCNSSKLSIVSSRCLYRRLTRFDEPSPLRVPLNCRRTPYCKAGYLVYKDKGIVIMKTSTPVNASIVWLYKVSVNALLIPYIPRSTKTAKRLFFNREQDCFIIRLYASNELRIVHV